MAEHKLEAHCECGACWWFFDAENPDDITVECNACGGTVTDIRDLGEHHSAGRDVAS